MADIEVKLPEGVKADDPAVVAFKKLMADPNLTPSQRAQAVLELSDSQVKAQQKAVQEQAQRKRVSDLEAVKADSEFGGAKYDRTLADAQKGLKFFGGESLSKKLVAAGLDCDPDVVKAFARAGAALAEDQTKPPPGPLPGDQKPAPMTVQQALQQRYLKPKK